MELNQELTGSRMDKALAHSKQVHDLMFAAASKGGSLPPMGIRKVLMRAEDHVRAVGLRWGIDPADGSSVARLYADGVLPMRVRVSEREHGFDPNEEVYLLAELVAMDDGGDPDGKAAFMAIVPRVIEGEMMTLVGGAAPLVFVEGVL